MPRERFSNSDHSAPMSISLESIKIVKVPIKTDWPFPRTRKGVTPPQRNKTREVTALYVRGSTAKVLIVADRWRQRGEIAACEQIAPDLVCLHLGSKVPERKAQSMFTALRMAIRKV